MLRRLLPHHHVPTCIAARRAVLVGQVHLSSSSSTMAAAFEWDGLVKEEVSTLKRPFLVIRGAAGYIGCGYLDCAGKRKPQDAAAVIQGPVDRCVCRCAVVLLRPWLQVACRCCTACVQ